ncbi:MAG TPA: DUF4262 domain-containing protein [Acidimicrobiia bacterium]|nr:DUF4262 domain-containing protein [Acidimicrobiia bacterium]
MDLEAWYDQEDARITATIRRVGWVINYIGGDSCRRPGCDSPPHEGPPFAYTIGMFGMGHPELLMLGVDPATANGVLNTLGTRIKHEGVDLMPGEILELDQWTRRVIPEQVPNPGDIVLWANDYYRRPPEHSVPVLQLTYDDDAGRFPWDEGYADPEMQPRPGTFAA